MFPTPVTPETVPAFRAACAHEHIFGSKALTALLAHGLTNNSHRFFHCGENAALWLSQGVLTVSAAEHFDPAPIAQLARQEAVHEIDLSLAHARILREALGGTLESSCFMVYEGDPQPPACPEMRPGELPAVFEILQQSHEYYRTHLSFEAWSADLSCRLDCGLSELWQLSLDGRPVGTASIASEDAECAVIAAVAVIPEYRHRGCATLMTRELVHRIQQEGKTPRLLAGYDAVANLYKKIGFAACGLWGELYLP